ncbi:nucleoside-diphosphate kinase [Vulcanisaeta souniana]|uniref:Nucleoside diphosphate kinase n=1 Tax=Vulcanisaeta souniana JCM 11219 TaxID=1293586 RepID=A0A830E1P7_9CREN|nr:nucleoside-diphosphate kinase [Vulcanisaeta souniana]BDR93518.1 nucleoside-diphosphate kinase [Vulcanisaeta souniana JCM 11219]GGI77781.1 nucleoside-diphosphate kinase [Vulcanisaeta souniana JCM 11219]
MIERTLVIVKPDAVKKGLIGEVISRFERAGLRIIAMKMIRLSKEEAAKFYPSDENWLRSVGGKTLKSYSEIGKDPKIDLGTDDPVEIGKIIRGWLADYLSMGPIVVMVLEGNRAVEVVRKIIGSTTPYSSPPGTIRGDYSVDSPDLANIEKRALFNLVHASDSPREAEREIKFFFRENEFINYS